MMEGKSKEAALDFKLLVNVHKKELNTLTKFGQCMSQLKSKMDTSGFKLDEKVHMILILDTF